MTWLAELYEEINRAVFSGSLSRPEVVRNSTRTTVLHFAAPNTVELGDPAEATAADFLDELLHVMVHHANHAAKLPDNTPNQYHNNHFKVAALGVGLYVEQQKHRGWGRVFAAPTKISGARLATPAPAANMRLRRALAALKWSEPVWHRIRASIPSPDATKPAKQFQIKYVCRCPPPHNNVRSGRRPTGPHPLKIVCEVCGSKFVPAKGRC
jgi:hypothetical protein